VPRAACASRSRRGRCWRSLTNVLPKPGPVSATSSSQASGSSPIFRCRPASDRSTARCAAIGGLSQSPALRGIRRRRRRDGEESLHRRTLFTINDIASVRQNLLSLQSTDVIDNSATNKVIANLASASTLETNSLKTGWRCVCRAFVRTMFRNVVSCHARARLRTGDDCAATC
jgi:hypothetical protein